MEVDQKRNLACGAGPRPAAECHSAPPKRQNATPNTGQSGQALIEFMLLILTLLFIVFAAINFGLAIRNLQILSDATQSGAAWGANSTYHAALWGGSAAAGWNGPQSIEAVASNASAALGTTVVTVTNYCTCLPGSPQVACSSTCGGSSGLDQPLFYVKVMATTTFPAMFQFPGLPPSFSMTSSSVMPVD